MKVKKAQEQLLEWYEAHGRKNLPWRLDASPYEVFISEMMLQQTQVSTVLSRFYFPFLARFPSLDSLAQSEEAEILLAWKGLGYYSRARRIHQIARACSNGLPSSVTELEKLPGIGPYTARAIACFGFGESVAVVDGNIKRILYRLFALQQSTTPKLLQEKAEGFLNPDSPFAHNQALLDIGALICKPNRAECHLCPLEVACLGKDDPQAFRVRRTQIYEDLTLYYLFCQKEGALAMRQETGGRYQGLWSLPSVEKIPQSEKEMRFVGSIKHALTRYRITAHLYEADSKILSPAEAVWVRLDEIPILPISSLTEKLLRRAATQGLL